MWRWTVRLWRLSIFALALVLGFGAGGTDGLSEPGQQPLNCQNTSIATVSACASQALEKFPWTQPAGAVRRDHLDK